MVEGHEEQKHTQPIIDDFHSFGIPNLWLISTLMKKIIIIFQKK
jgi:hypothetical protein